MKKNLKRITMCLMSTIMVQLCCFIPQTSAAEATVNIKTDWDSKAIGTTFNRGNNVAVYSNGSAGKNILYVNGNTEQNSTTGTAVSVAADPLDKSGANKVLMVDKDKSGTGQVKFFNYVGRPTPNLVVVQSKVMFTAPCGDSSWGNDGGQTVYFYGFPESVRVGGLDKPLYRMNYNQWYELKYVYDMTAVLKDDNGTPILNSDGLQQPDAKKATVTLYINDTELWTKSFSEVNLVESAGNPKYLISYFNVGAKRDDGAKVYLDDFTSYYGAEESEIEIENYNTLNNSVYMAGTSLKLSADSYIGKDFNVPFDKIEWYCDDELIGEGESIEYTPSVGEHTIYAGGYINDNDAEIPSVYSDDLTITVEPGFAEEVLMNEDFEDYTDGVKSWYDNDSANKTWNVPSAATAVTVDDIHKKSLNTGTNSGRAVWAGIDISNGTVKITGEYYFNTFGNSTVLDILNNGKKDVNHLVIHSNTLRDIVSDTTMQGTELAALANQRWYKVDLVLTFKEGQGYYNIYLDGRRLTQNAYSYGEYTSIAQTNKVMFLAAYNSAEIYLDNLKISKISYDESTNFYDGENKITQMSDIAGKVLTAKTLSAGGPDCTQYLAIYDKTTNRLVNVVQGTFDSATAMFTAECDISEYGDIYAKAFLWNDMIPVSSLCELR